MTCYLIMFGVGWFYTFCNKYPKPNTAANNVADIQIKLLLKIRPDAW